MGTSIDAAFLSGKCDKAKSAVKLLGSKDSSGGENRRNPRPIVVGAGGRILFIENGNAPVLSRTGDAVKMSPDENDFFRRPDSRFGGDHISGHLIAPGLVVVI